MISWDSSVSSVISYGLDGWEVDIKGANASLVHVVQKSSGAYWDPNKWVGTDSSIFGGGGGIKWPGCEADHSPLTSAKVKNTWIYTSIPSHVFMV
jgi:hypothetical protein